MAATKSLPHSMTPSLPLPMTDSATDPTRERGASATRSVRSIGRGTAIALLCVGSLGLAGCGESSGEKAAKQVCSATAEIRTQLTKLQSLPVSSSFPGEAKSSVEAIGKSADKISEAAPNLEPARKEEVEAANKAFGTEIAMITKDVVSASTSSNLSAALKSAEPQIKAALNRLAADYKKAFEALKCS
jgi:hypothetical protein